jgi:hypothetical protein
MAMTLRMETTEASAHINKLTTIIPTGNHHGV